jgi:thiol-disulfide isomerase/thioredoxin
MTQSPDRSPKAAAAEAENAASAARGRRRILFGAAIVAGGVLGLAGVYGIGGFLRNAGDAACRPAFELARRIAPLAHGEVAAVALASQALLLPDLAFGDAGGGEKHLADWRGRTVLLNLWATWCVPCRQEMPALDALQAKLGGPDFEVVAVNIDTRASAKPREWLDEVGIKRLAFYADPSAKVFTDLKLINRAFGMPTTLIVDRAGCEIGTIAGPAEWESDDGVKLITAALGNK